MTKYDRFMEVVTLLTKILVVIVASVMTILVFSQVITRYIIGSSPAFMVELSSYCLIWTSFLGASLAVRWGKHVAVTAIVDIFNERVRKILGYIANGIVLTFLIIYLAASFQYATGQWIQFSPTMGFRHTWPALGATLGTFLMILQLIHNMVSPAPTPNQDEGSIS